MAICHYAGPRNVDTNTHESTLSVACHHLSGMNSTCIEIKQITHNVNCYKYDSTLENGS